MKIATYIDQNREALLVRWEKIARERIVAAQQTESLALRDHLPYIIKDMQNALVMMSEKDGVEAASKCFTKEYSEQHGRHRASTPGYTVSQIIHEYAILRYVIVDLVHQAGLCDYRSVEAITQVLEFGAQQAIEEFVKSIEKVQHALLGTLAHDIRTPLSVAITAMLAMKKSAIGKEESEEMNDLALQGVARALDMLSGLLDTITTQAGDGIMLNFEESDFRKEVENTYREAQKTYSKRIIGSFSPDAINGVFDPVALRRIIENLISNAIRYGGSSDPVTIALEDGDDSIVLSVSNKGKPIAKERFEEIFDFISSTGSNSNQETKNWGMGLSYVKMSVEGHQGTIKLVSTAEEGTTFFIHIPKFSNKVGSLRTKLMKDQLPEK